MYFVRVPYLVKKFYPEITWDLPNRDGKVYLTFDDGPHPEVTPWVLDLLKQQHAKATFFCLGKNVERYPDVYKRILDEGHAVGNHTFSHPDGWKTNDDEYLENAGKAKEFIGSDFFRPPYGKIKQSQAKKIIYNLKSKIYNFSLIPGDFDPTMTSEKCYKNLQRVRSGDIIVLHDSQKASKHLYYCLPRFFEEFKMFKFEAIK